MMVLRSEFNRYRSIRKKVERLYTKSFYIKLVDELMAEELSKKAFVIHTKAIDNFVDSVKDVFGEHTQVSCFTGIIYSIENYKARTVIPLSEVL